MATAAPVEKKTNKQFNAICFFSFSNRCCFSVETDSTVQVLWASAIRLYMLVFSEIGWNVKHLLPVLKNLQTCSGLKLADHLSNVYSQSLTILYYHCALWRFEVRKISGNCCKKSFSLQNNNVWSKLFMMQIWLWSNDHDFMKNWG